MESVIIALTRGHLQSQTPPSVLSLTNKHRTALPKRQPTPLYPVSIYLHANSSFSVIFTNVLLVRANSFQNMLAFPSVSFLPKEAFKNVIQNIVILS